MKTELGIRTSLAPQVDPAQVDMLCEFLRGKGWMKAAAIEAAIAIDDRKVRAFAEHSDGRILSGQEGYRLFERSTPIEEADQAASWLESQAKRMVRRASSIRQRLHRYAREKTPTTEQQTELVES